MITGIVLAAGASFRMGTPKALLKAGSGTFLQSIFECLSNGGIDDVVIVLGADAGIVRKSLKGFQATIVINEQWKEGQLSSFLTGLEAAIQHSADHVLVWPVDRPLVSELTLSILCNASKKHPESIIIPTCKHRRGHPVIFPKRFFAALRAAPPGIGARHVVRENSKSVIEVETPEEGIILNIDTPEDYQQYSTKFIRTNHPGNNL